MLFFNKGITNVHLYCDNFVGYIFILSSNLDIYAKEHSIFVGESYNLIVELKSVSCQENITLEIVQFKSTT